MAILKTSTARYSLTDTLAKRGMALVVLGIVAMYALPIIMVIYGAFRDAAPGQEGGLSFTGLANVFSSGATYLALKNSLWLAIVVGLASTILAIISAWIATNSKAPLARLMTPIAVIGLATPPLFYALAWDLLGTPRIGLLSKAFASIGIENFAIDGALGTAVILSLKVSTLIYFVMLGAFGSMDHRMEEAGLIAGASGVRVFATVTLPMLSPAIAGAFILAFIIGLTAFDIPLLVAGSGEFPVVSTLIFSMLNEQVPPNYSAASSIALILMLAVILLVAIKWWALDRRTFATIGGKSTVRFYWNTGRSTPLLTLWVILYALALVILPFTQVILGSLQRVFGVGGSLSLRNYVELLNDPALAPALRNTFLLAFLGGLIATAIALILALIGRHSSSALRRGLELTTWLPWAANGILLGLGLVWGFLSLPFLTPLFGTVWIVLIGLVISATPLAARTIDGAIAQIGKELEESALVAGASTFRVAIGIVLRLMLPSFMAAWFIAAINIVGNLEVPILLSLPSNKTMAVEVYRLYGNGESSMAAAMFVLVFAIGGILALIGFIAMKLGQRLLANRNRAQIGHVLAHAAVASTQPTTKPQLPNRTNQLDETSSVQVKERD